MKKLGALLLIFTLLLVGCGETGTDKTPENAATPTPSSNTNKPAADKTVPDIRVMKTVTVDMTDAEKPIVTFTLGNDSVIKAELYPETAPITVENFIKLIDDKFYDGLTFHRIEPGFVIQGGDPMGNGTGGPGWNIKGEFSSNGVENNLKHERGVLSMARSSAPDSAGSQFFIMHGVAPHLDGDYAAFGMVIEGLEVVDEIVASK